MMMMMMMMILMMLTTWCCGRQYVMMVAAVYGLLQGLGHDDDDDDEDDDDADDDDECLLCRVLWQYVMMVAAVYGLLQGLGESYSKMGVDYFLKVCYPLSDEVVNDSFISLTMILMLSSSGHAQAPARRHAGLRQHHPPPLGHQAGQSHLVTCVV
jgi:hypothetical protein